jgi:hypothetical protein
LEIVWMCFSVSVFLIFLVSVTSISSVSNTALDLVQQDDSLSWVVGDGPIATFDTDANVRQGPGRGFPIVGGIRAGTRSEILAVNPAGDWYRVRYWNRAGWVFALLVTVSGDTSGLPIDSGPALPAATEAPPQQLPSADQQVPAGQPGAPGTNLLIDPGFEGTYIGRGAVDLNIPQGWDIWFALSPHTADWMNLRPVAFPHRTGPEIHSGLLSLNLNKGWATFTAVVYQQVYVPPGAAVRANAWAWLHVCGDPSNDNPPGCGSDPNSGAGVRIGIDPDGGDPNAPEIVWSRFATPHDRWGQVSVEAQARAPVVTLLLFTHQHNPKAFNTMYWDSAYLEYIP